MSKVRTWILTPAAVFGALGWAATQVDTRYVHTAEYRAHQSLDSLQRVRDSITSAILLVKLDSANLRLTQIQCGKRIESGCR
jgi:hypothetical protein